MNGTLLEMSLYGGVADGAVVPMPLKDPGSTYLVRYPRESAQGIWDVLAYEEAGRTDSAGRMVLRFVRVVGFQGFESNEIRKEQGHGSSGE